MLNKEANNQNENKINNKQQLIFKNNDNNKIKIASTQMYKEWKTLS